jgi:uncharacterized protein YoxC
MNWEISLTIFTLSFLALSVVIIMFLLQFLKTAKNFEVTLQIVNSKLPEVLSDIHEIIKNLMYATHVLRGKIEAISFALEKVQKLANLVEALKPSIETPLLKAVGNLSALKKGVGIFLSVLKSREK